jgi:hypothetical protein
MGNHPLVFTEIGIPYDMDDKYAYKTGDFSSQKSAMDANHYALEGSRGNGFSLWTYMTQVRVICIFRICVKEITDLMGFKNTHQWGDHWNGEDLSIYSVDDRELPGNESLSQSTSSLDPNSPAFSLSRMNAENSKIAPNNLKIALQMPSISQESQSIPQLSNNPGFRAAEAFIRPSPIATHGLIIQYGFDLRNCTFSLSLSCDTATTEDAPTIIYLPGYHFPSIHTEVSLSGGKWTVDVEEVGSGSMQLLRWWHPEGDQNIRIQGAKRKAGEVLDTSEDEGYLEQCQRSSCILM